MRTSEILVSIAGPLLLTVTASAQTLASYDAGLAGSAGGAPDPTGLGWTLEDPSGGAVLASAVSPDGMTGFNAWRLDDAATFGGGRLHYAAAFTSTEILSAASAGWELETSLRVLSSSGVDVFMEYAEGQSSQDDRYLIFIESAGQDAIVHDLLGGNTFLCPGAGDGSFHSFLIRKPAGFTSLDADLLYDGTVLGTLPRSNSSGNAADGGVRWGMGSSAQTAVAHFQRVEFRQNPSQGPDFVDVFRGGDGVYPAYRIPALLQTEAGTLLAFAEGRASLSDHAQNDMVMRRSLDGGATWGPVVTLHDDGANSLNNPCVVQVATGPHQGPHQGRILLHYQRYPNGCHESCVVEGYTGNNVCRSFSMHSDDDGVTWSLPREVSTEVKRPTVATSVASGPGVGIQKLHAPHAGRLLMPFNQGEAGAVWRVYMAYSDDGGDTWSYGNLADDTQSAGFGNEVQVAELSDGVLQLNARSHQGNHLRKIAWSLDGGENWTPLMDQPALIEPQVMASFIRYSDPIDGRPSRHLYSGPNSQTSRQMGAVHMSYDGGLTWPVSRSLYPGGFAYSVLAPLANGDIGCLFERDGYSAITLARARLDWLTQGADCAEARALEQCATTPNTVGQGASMDVAGSFSIAVNDLDLVAAHLPPSTFTLCFYGRQTTQIPLGDGTLCVSAAAGLFRLPIGQASSAGTLVQALDFSTLPAVSGPGQIQPGVTQYFQCWYRDATTSGGVGSNLSQAIAVTFCP